MSTRTTGAFPTSLEVVRQRFEKWRRTRQAGARIPKLLWVAAVKMAGIYGLHRTARALPVEYYSLKKHVELAAAPGGHRRATAFIAKTTSPCMAEQFHDECRHVLEALAAVYRNDAIAKERNLPPQERLALHQTESGPVMQTLHAWLGRQFDERRVEPNSGLGASIAYMLRHWEKLTLFLRVAGAPLDNNICERALKLSLRHRKNSLFYKTLRGAHVGDVFMSMIHTCRLCGANPFDYLTEVDRHAQQAALNPGAWLPWNYRQTLAEADQLPAAA